MAKPFVIILLGSLALFHLCSQVSAGVRHHIEPIVSNVYYLQDYCNLPDEKLEEKLREEKYRHRRSSESSEEEDIDYDHDHDHDHIGAYDIKQDVHQVVKYYAKKGYGKVKSQIKREMEFRQKWKQVYLDPVMQPSVVVRLWRPDSVEENQQHNRILDDAPPNKQIHCKILLRFSGDTTNVTFGSSINALANSTLGAVVNFLKLNQKPWLNDYRLRIVTSDPNMTQYWLAGRKLATGAAVKSSTISSTQQLPVAVDLVTHPQLHPEPLMKDDMDLLQMINNAGKWLLIELETINQTINSKLSELTKKGRVDQQQQNGISSQGQDDTELVINLYTQSTKSSNADGQQSAQQNGHANIAGNTSSLQCPIGTFDCAGDGLQCIPSGLRCNGEDNCGNRFDELFNCGTVNLYYIFGSDGHHSQFDFESDGFWFAVRILILLFLICLVLYMSSLLCRCCCDRRAGYIINGRSPMVYVRSAKGGPSSGAEPLLGGGSSAGFGATAGRAMKMPMNNNNQMNAGGGPPSPPPSYFGNQSDNQKSNVQEYIYVNNNYGQPQGSTTVYTSVRPATNVANNGQASAPPYMDNFPPLYPNIEYPNYGGTNKC